MACKECRYLVLPQGHAGRCAACGEPLTGSVFVTPETVRRVLLRANDGRLTTLVLAGAVPAAGGAALVYEPEGPA